MIEALERVVFIWLFILSCFCAFGVIFLAVILVLAGQAKEMKERVEGRGFVVDRGFHDEKVEED